MRRFYPRHGLPLWLACLALLLAGCRPAPDEANPPPVASSTPSSVPTLTATSTPLPPTATPTITPSPTPHNVAGFPDPSLYAWRLVVDGLEFPVSLVHAGDGSGRLFVLEQRGLIRVLVDGVVSPEPFLDISSQVGCCGERGLLGLVFHPRYAENGFFYVNYTDLNSDTVIARFQVSTDPQRADPDSELRLIGVDQPFPNHNGGSLAFGPDGYLYLGLGDGGSGGDPRGNGQNTQVLLGKLLRIDVDAGEPYAIPADNPFASGGGAPEVWAYGLRNPWRFSFDRLTGDLYLADVGQGDWEEVDFLPAGSPGGANFGWNYREGSHPFQGASPPTGLELIDPVVDYDHTQGCSVTGGYVYRGDRMPEWRGVYLYGDFCTGFIWGLLQNPAGDWQHTLLFEAPTRIASFGEDETGEIYLVIRSGEIYQLVPAADLP